MQVKFKFICCSEYDFDDRETGKHMHGFSCKAYDPTSKQIVKVRTNHQINKEFGAEITCNVIFNGRYVNYEVA
jgi:hypothetical protein